MSSVGTLLNEYRKTRRISQMDLGLQADVSSRHISFIENGRSQPSREMLLRLADVLDLSLRDSNLLLASGGYAAAYSEIALNSPAMSAVYNALNIMLDNHNPYPAIVVDNAWNIVMANSAYLAFSGLLAGTSSTTEVNLIRMVLGDTQFRSIIRNWDEVASYLLRRLKKQVLVFSSPELNSLYQEVMEFDLPDNWQQPNTPTEGPMLTVNLKIGELELSTFSTLSQFGSSLDVGIQELLIESYFPADDITKDFFHSLSLD